jgi:hypothetical protein
LGKSGKVITVILISLAAIFKAVADTLDDHFDTSIFKRLPWQLWDANRATTNKFWFTGYKFDPWHICNSLLIICFSLAIIFNDLKTEWHWQLIIIGGVFNLTFNLFYTHILRRK